VPVIFEDMIPSYREAEGVGGALARMSKRVKRSNPLAGGGAELFRHYQGVHEDFLGFMPEVRRCCSEFLNAYDLPSSS
jgi:acyl carrier protein phosphodiesterase